MKVFLLGGYGKTGLPAARLLAQSDLVTEIAIAGRSLERAEKAAIEIGEKAIPVHTDGTDQQKLTPLLAGYDVIMNAAYNDTVLPTIRAAIRAGTHYCDLSWGDVLEPALQLGSEAETAGITAIVATGISPCISNLMGVHVAGQLEEVEQLQIGRADVFDFATGGELTPQQWLMDPKESFTALLKFRSYFEWQLKVQHDKGLRTVLDYQDGQWVELDPIRNGLDVPHLEKGTIHLYPYVSTVDYWGMLPLDLAKVSPVEIWFSPFPPQLNAVLREKALLMLEGQIDPDLLAFYQLALDEKDNSKRFLLFFQLLENGLKIGDNQTNSEYSQLKHELKRLVSTSAIEENVIDLIFRYRNDLVHTGSLPFKFGHMLNSTKHFCERLLLKLIQTAENFPELIDFRTYLIMVSKDKNELLRMQRLLIKIMEE